jgi:1,4-alpha-glucan branching enzyme
MQHKAKLALVFHAHLPYVLGHGTWPHGTDWLYEAAAESYIPLLDALCDLVEDGISPKVTVSITPVLAEQLADESFVSGFERYLEQQIDTAAANRNDSAAAADATRGDLAEFWRTRYENTLVGFRHRYARSLCGAFRELQDKEHIEIMTSMATHCYAPLLLRDESIQAQVSEGVKSYERLLAPRMRVPPPV